MLNLLPCFCEYSVSWEINPLNEKTLSQVIAEACISIYWRISWRSSSQNGKIRMLGGKRNEACKHKKRGEDLNKTAIIVFSLDWAGSWEAKFGDPWDGKKEKKNPLLRPPSNVRLVPNLYRSTKALLRGRDDYIFLDQCPKYIVSAVVWGSKWFLHTGW